MELDISEQSLPVYEALASPVRIKVIQLLAQNSMNIKELADAVGVSSAIMTKHVKKLETANLIHTEMVPGKAGIQKRCTLNTEKIQILFPSSTSTQKNCIETEVSVGHYTNFHVEPTCGLATPQKIIGEFDEPRYFLDPERVNAKILWYGQGFIEYKVPNFLKSNQVPNELEISMEISSEAPFTNDNWPSDISFYLNNVSLGKWTSPGDFGDKPGKYTPSWWPSVINQYGLLKHLRITSHGTYMEGKWLSEVKLDDLKIREKQWIFRIAVEDESVHVGGVTLFGRGFGNYNQDLLFRLYYD